MQKLTRSSLDLVSAMRPNYLVRLFTLLLLTVVATSASARWYQVEVITFQHASGLSTGDEQWPELLALPDFSDTVDLIVDLPEMDDEPVSAGSADQHATPIAFRQLDRGEMHLAGVERRLRNSSSYEVLSATAWRQPSFGVRRARRVYLTDSDLRSLTAEPEPGSDAALRERHLEGIVSIKVSRLLHIEVDYLYYHEGSPIRLAETRKAKLREIHYFDHPLFGVIVQVSPYLIPVPVEQSSEDEAPDDSAPGEPSPS